MPKLSKFTINSDYPATARVGNYTSVTVTPPSEWYSGNEGKTFLADFDVPSGAILMPIIQQGQLNRYVGNGYAWQDDYWREEIWIERLSPTRIRFVAYITNLLNYVALYGGNSFTLYVSTFTMP